VLSPADSVTNSVNSGAVSYVSAETAEGEWSLWVLARAGVVLPVRPLPSFPLRLDFFSTELLYHPQVVLPISPDSCGTCWRRGSPTAPSGSVGCCVRCFCVKGGEDFGGSDDVLC
jgi:hypothetical protein